MNAVGAKISSLVRTMRFLVALWCGVVAASTMPCAGDETNNQSTKVDFAKEIAPVLVTNCIGCHDNKKREGGYSIENVNDLFTAGESGIAPIAIENGVSELIRRLRSEDESERMPAESNPLPQETIARIEEWVKQGAEVNVERDKPLATLVSNESTFAPPEHYPRALPVSAIGVTPDGQTAIVGGYGEVLFWNLSNSTLAARLRVQGVRVSDIEVSRDGHFMAIASGTPGVNGSVQLFTPVDNGVWQLKTSLALSDAPLDVAISPDSKYTLVGTGSGSLILLNNEEGKEVLKMDSHAAAITAVAWSSDSSKFYTASRDRSAKSYKSPSGEILGSFAEHERVVGGVAEAYNGAYTLEESGRLSNWIEGVQSHRISQKHNFSARVSKLLRVENQVMVLESDKLRILNNISKEVPDGNDKDGKPKTKWNNWFEDDYELDSHGKKLLCFSVLQTEDTFKVLAGTLDGSVLVWEPNESQDVQMTLVSRP